LVVAREARGPRETTLRTDVLLVPSTIILLADLVDLEPLGS
jgi:hypothetical protein